MVARATYSFDFISAGSHFFHDWQSFFFNIVSFQEVEGRLKQQQQHYITLPSHTHTRLHKEHDGRESSGATKTNPSSIASSEYSQQEPHRS